MSVGGRKVFNPAVLVAGGVVGTAVGGVSGWRVPLGRRTERILFPGFVFFVLLGAGLFLMPGSFWSAMAVSVQHQTSDGPGGRVAIVLAWLSPEWSRFDREEQVVRSVEALLGVPIEVEPKAVGF